MQDRSGPEPLAGRRVLVVEDDWLVGEVLCLELEDSGAEVLGPAVSLTQALSLLEEHGLPDAAVLDVELKHAKSYPVAERLAAEQVPVVFTTGRPCTEVK
jgi:CheY-like chemotaxis protein